MSGVEPLLGLPDPTRYGVRPQLRTQGAGEQVLLVVTGADGTETSGIFCRQDLLAALSEATSVLKVNHRFDGYDAHPDQSTHRAKCQCGHRTLWEHSWSAIDSDLDNHIETATGART